MKIILHPQVSSAQLNVVKYADSLTINGTLYDFGPLEEGEVLPRLATDCEFLQCGNMTRIGGELVVHLLMPIASDASEAARFPQPLENVPDGPVEFPQ